MLGITSFVAQVLHCRARSRLNGIGSHSSILELWSLWVYTVTVVCVTVAAVATCMQQEVVNRTGLRKGEVQDVFSRIGDIGISTFRDCWIPHALGIHRVNNVSPYI